MDEIYVTRHDNVKFKQPPNGILNISGIHTYEKYYIVQYDYSESGRYKYTFDIYNADNKYITCFKMENIHIYSNSSSIYRYVKNYKIIGDYFVNWDNCDILITNILHRANNYFVSYRVDSIKDTGIHNIADIIYINDTFYYCLTGVSYKKYIYKLQLSQKKDARKTDHINECLDLDYTGLNKPHDIDYYIEYGRERAIYLSKLNDKLVSYIPTDKETYLIIIWNLGKTKLTIYRYEYMPMNIFPDIQIYNNLISIGNGAGVAFISLDKTVIYNKYNLPGHYMGLTHNNYLIMRNQADNEFQIIDIRNKQCILKFTPSKECCGTFYVIYINNQLNIYLWKAWRPNLPCVTYQIRTKKELLIRYTTLFRGLNMQLIYNCIEFSRLR